MTPVVHVTSVEQADELFGAGSTFGQVVKDFLSFVPCRAVAELARVEVECCLPTGHATWHHAELPAGPGSDAVWYSWRPS